MKKLLSNIAKSKTMDALGAIIIVGAVIALGYYKTPLAASKFFANFHGAFFTVYPIIGIVSTLSALASVMSTRYVAKLNNFGNVIGWINTIVQGILDFVLGNVGAILTYPVSVYLNWKAGKNWSTKYKDGFGTPKNFKKFLPVLIFGAIMTSFTLNAIAYTVSGWGFDPLFYFASITFAFSLMADVLNVYKMPAQWTFWFVYNFAQLGKALMMGNIANVAKYVYYIINSIVGGIYWLAQKATKAVTA